MKIAFIENENPYKPINGGISAYIRILIDDLGKKGNEVLLIGSGESEKKESKRLTFSFKSICRKECSNIKFFLRFFFKLKEYNNTVQILHFFHTYYLLCFLFYRPKAKLVLTLPGKQDVSFRNKRGKIAGWVNDNLVTPLAARLSDLVIFVDKSTSQHYISKSSLFLKKSVIIPAFVDLERFFPMNKNVLREKYDFKKLDKIVIYVGRLSIEKNIPFLIESYKILENDLENTLLLIAGNGKQESFLKDYVNDIGINNLRFIRNASDSQVAELMNCADLLALTSHYEGSPTVVKEAIACHLPVVSLDVGDVREVLGNLKGCIISEPDTAFFAWHMKEVLTASDRFNPGDKIKDFAVEKSGELIIDCYKDLLGEN